MICCVLAALAALSGLTALLPAWARLRFSGGCHHHRQGALFIAMGAVTGLVLVLAVTLHLAGSTTQLASLASNSICSLAGHSSEHADLWLQWRLSSLKPAMRTTNG